MPPWLAGTDPGTLPLILLLGLPRLAGALTVAPFMGGAVLGGQSRLAVIGALSLIPAPSLLPDLRALAASGPGFHVYLALAAKEAALGLAIGWVSGIVFWAVQSAGFLMDNQRGASMASGPNPLSGDETTPLGSLLFQGVAAVFFLGGGFMSFLRLLWSSYAVWPAGSLAPAIAPGAGPLFFVSLVDWLMLQTLLLAGPVVAACLLTDVSLGLVNRFASQLNVYVLSMPVKSGMTAFVLVGYYAFLISLGPDLFRAMFDQLWGLLGVR
jgi:type III secretion protein T